MKQELEKPERSRQGSEVRLAGPRSFAGGWTGWLLGRLRAARRAPPRLAVLDRIALAPRQSLALVEAEGRRFLVATSPEGTPAFYPLDGPGRRSAQPRPFAAHYGVRAGAGSGSRLGYRAALPAERVSW